MSTELAIPNEPFTVYYDDDWKSIAEIFNTYKKQFIITHGGVEDCLGLATQWRKFQTEPPKDPKEIDLFLDHLSKSLKRYDLLPDLRDNIPANIDEIIDTLAIIRDNYRRGIKGQEEAIDAIRRFVRACAILQDLHTHGVSTQVPEDLLKKLKDDIELVSVGFSAYKNEQGFKDGTAIELAEVFCRGTYQIEDWLLQHVYNSICLHNKITPTIDVPSTIKKIDDVNSGMTDLNKKMDDLPNKINTKKTSRKPSNSIPFDQVENIMLTQCPDYAVGEREIRRWINQGHTTRGNFPITWDNLTTREAWIKWCRDYRWHRDTKGGSEAIPPDLIHKKYRPS